ALRPSPSFPTRRSSDLLLVAAASAAPAGAAFFRRFARELAAAAAGNGPGRAGIAEVLEGRDLLAPGEARKPADRHDRVAAMALGGGALPTRILEAVRETLGASREEEILLRTAPDGSLRGRRPRDL